MKPQDLLFIVSLFLILRFSKEQFIPAIALICIVMAIPLYATWTFFTAERLIWYAAFLITCYLIREVWIQGTVVKHSWRKSA